MEAKFAFPTMQLFHMSLPIIDVPRVFAHPSKALTITTVTLEHSSTPVPAAPRASCSQHFDWFNIDIETAADDLDDIPFVELSIK